MSDAGPTLDLRFEWVGADGVTTAELAATWARLEVLVGSECVTQVEDVHNNGVRRSIYVSLYPLAEWAVSNWWFLTAHRRPAGENASSWSYSHVRQHRWLSRHNLRGVGEGMAWPDLTVLPEGSWTRLVWRADRGVEAHRPVRFIREGGRHVGRAQLDLALTGLVEAVLSRLVERGLPGTPLAKEWELLRATDSEEVAFCLAAARLGLDPYDLDDATAAVLEKVGDVLAGRLLDDFVAAVEPSRLDEGLAWVEEAARQAEAVGGSAEQSVGALRAGFSPFLEDPRLMPWSIGWEQARRTRQLLDLSNTEKMSFDGVVQRRSLPSPDVSLQGLAGSSDGSAPFVVVGSRGSERTARFTTARGLWHVLLEPSERLSLVTPATSIRQRVERAFAAELLAPSEGIEELLDGRRTVSQEDVDGVAERYEVSARVVEHQIENQLSMQLVDS